MNFHSLPRETPPEVGPGDEPSFGEWSLMAFVVALAVVAAAIVVVQ